MEVLVTLGVEAMIKLMSVLRSESDEERVLDAMEERLDTVEEWLDLGTTERVRVGRFGVSIGGNCRLRRDFREARFDLDK